MSYSDGSILAETTHLISFCLLPTLKIIWSINKWMNEWMDEGICWVIWRCFVLLFIFFYYPRSTIVNSHLLYRVSLSRSGFKTLQKWVLYHTSLVKVMLHCPNLKWYILSADTRGLQAGSSAVGMACKTPLFPQGRCALLDNGIQPGLEEVLPSFQSLRIGVPQVSHSPQAHHPETTYIIAKSTSRFSDYLLPGVICFSPALSCYIIHESYDNDYTFHTHCKH